MSQMPDYVAPVFKLEAFNCPHCGAYSNMRWEQLRDGSIFRPVWNAQCAHCKKDSFWLVFGGPNGKVGRMIEPALSPAPPPHPKMPVGARADYEEAAKVAAVSPRSAAALLRLAIQRLCIDLGLPGKNLNSDIGELVKRGLPERVTKALDAVRVIGNNAVHPGEMSPDDVAAVSATLFKVLNLIVEHVIAAPAEVDDLFDGLPEGAKSQIQKRDSKAG